MSRQKVEKIQCDRCKRGELRPIQENLPAVRPPDFEASFLNQKLVYADLCGTCVETLKNIWEQGLKQWSREVKQMVVPLNGHADQAAPLQVAPNYTPVQPHSAAAAKK